MLQYYRLVDVELKYYIKDLYCKTIRRNYTSISNPNWLFSLSCMAGDKYHCGFTLCGYLFIYWVLFSSCVICLVEKIC